MTKTAIVTDVSGQDGAYLAENLLAWGCAVYGTYHQISSFSFWWIDELGVGDHPNLKLVEYDLADMGSTIRLIDTSEATEMYNLAAQSFVGVSFCQPITNGQITGLGAAYLLEAIHRVNRKHLPISGIDIRDVRQGPSSPADGRYSVLSTQPLRYGKTLYPLANGKLSGELRHYWNQESGA